MSEAVLGQVKALLDGSVDAAVILDEERRILYYNSAYQTASGLRGRSLEKAISDGKRCFEVFPLEICQTACVGCAARDAGRALRLDEIRATRGSDGEELTMVVTASPLPGGLLVETYRDVTADVRIQRKYKVLLDLERRAKEILEETVRARTDELRAANEEIKRTQAQLIHQEKMSSLGRLVAGIAHELNNPINFVYGNVDFLGQYLDGLLGLVQLYERGVEQVDGTLRAQLDAKKQEIEFDFLVDDSRKLIRSIRAGAERTAAIVRDLKAFSRTSGGEMQEADLVLGIETTLNLLAPVLKNRITVEKQVEADLPRVLCHPGHVNQVFMNILTNAAQAIKGPGTITIAIRRAGEHVQVAITDTGPGIKPEIQEKIFDPFFTTKDVGEGTGLGLAISESIVRAHGGTLTCQSPPGEGATFVVTMPIKAAAR